MGSFSHEWKRLFRIMKLTFLLSTVLVFNLSASVYSQNERLTLRLKNATLQQVLNNIEEQTDLHFFYQNEQVSNVSTITLNETEQTLDFILEKVLSGTNLDYRVVEKHVVIFAKTESKTTVQQQVARMLKGRVVDQSGAPLPGVSVVVDGTLNGTVTDVNGNFILDNVPPGSYVLFTFIGMKNTRLLIGNQTQIDLVMIDEMLGLDEVVVIGYGVQKKESLTGAISNVLSSDIQRSQATTTSGALVGKIAGVNS